MKIYTFHVLNVPKHCQTPKGIYPYIKTLKNFKIHNLFFNRLGDLFVQTPDKDGDKKIATLECIFQTALDISLLPSTKTFSCVIANVDFNITWKDIRNHVYHRLIDVWRIRSKTTDFETMYMRVVFADENSRDCLVQNGVVIFGEQYTVEMSHFELETDLMWNLKQANKIAVPKFRPKKKIALKRKSALSDSSAPSLPSPTTSTSSSASNTSTETLTDPLTDPEPSTEPEPLTEPELAPVYSSASTQTSVENIGNVIGFLEETVSVKHLLSTVCGVLLIYAWCVVVSQHGMCSQ